MAERRKVAMAYGDGIGPEVMRATLDVLAAARVPLDYNVVEIAEPAYLEGVSSGIPAEAWGLIRANKSNWSRSSTPAAG